MGAIFSRKKKAEETTLEKLEKLDGSIKALEENIQQDRRREKKVWATFLFTTGFLYITIAGILHLFVLNRVTLLDYIKLGLVWLSPIFLIYFSQRFIPWYFNWTIKETREKLKILRDDKKKILDNVREKEPYNKAKAILDKYDHQTPVPKPISQPVQRAGGPQGYQKYPVTQFPTTGTRPPGISGPVANRPLPYQSSPQFPMGRPPQIRERGVFDRVLDYVVKDGPENRMALICRRCGAHNGLCLLDEYDFTGFRCCECSLPNAPRKPRPSTVSLNQSASSLGSTSSLVKDLSSSSSSGSGTEEDTSQRSIRPPVGPAINPTLNPTLFTATVRPPVRILSSESQESSSTPVQSAQPVKPLSEQLAESDTGSESGDEMETNSITHKADTTTAENMDVSMTSLE